MNPRADPHIISDRDGICIFQPLISALKVYRVPRRIKTAIRRDKHVIAKRLFCRIEYDGIVVCEKVLANFDVVSIVTPKRRKYLKIALCPA